MTVLYNKPRRAQPSVEASLGVRFESMTELLRASDYVSLNVPDLPDTQGMAGDDFFAAMKPGACFVNTSRGSLVREDALYRALKSGHLAAAGLDVHAVEPRLAGDPLLALPNVTFSPHVAGGARSGVLQEFIVIADHIRASVGLA
jgi:phosphoglycerate dehydrogenase-like enzyme